jgi:hypothetical protein
MCIGDPSKYMSRRRCLCPSSRRRRLLSLSAPRAFCSSWTSGRGRQPLYFTLLLSVFSQRMITSRLGDCRLSWRPSIVRHVRRTSERLGSGASMSMRRQRHRYRVDEVQKSRFTLPAREIRSETDYGRGHESSLLARRSNDDSLYPCVFH